MKRTCLEDECFSKNNDIIRCFSNAKLMYILHVLEEKNPWCLFFFVYLFDATLYIYYNCIPQMLDCWFFYIVFRRERKNQVL